MNEQTIFGYKKKKLIGDNSFKLTNKTKRWINKKNIIMNGEVTILKENDNYYICCTFDTKTEEIKKRHHIVSLDPGIRTFQTFYSPDGICGKLGDNIIEPLARMGKKIDKLTSLINKKTNGKNELHRRTRRNMRKRCSLLRTKIKNIIYDLHIKVINFLCINFTTILIPNFASSEKVKRKPKIIRKINNKTVRNMLTLSHGKFMERLKEYGKRTRTQVIEVEEDYTSKTCGKCGHQKENLKSAKIYKCIECEYEEDRDINGARNILVKTISGHHYMRVCSDRSTGKDQCQKDEKQNNTLVIKPKGLSRKSIKISDLSGILRSVI